MISDVIIIGGGAAGLCAAVYLKQNNSNLSVRIIEALPRVGKKLALTGNGRCNISNLDINLTRYHGENVEFCQYALKNYGLNFTESFFEKIGIPFVFENQKAFPASLQGGSVVDCLRFAADELGVITHLDTNVTNIQISKGNYKVICDNLSFMAKNIIISAGLFSGGERLGCDGSILSIMKKAGYKTIKTAPAIVQLKTETAIVKQLKGIKVDANVSLKKGKNTIRTEFGETLFCDYGLSGPPVMQISREASRNEGDYSVSLDIIPDHSFNELFNMLENRKNNLKNRRLDEFFTGMLNKRLGQVVLKLSGCSLSDGVESLDIMKLKKITSVIKDMSFKVTGTTGFSNSQVTSGGLNTSQFDDKTMMSKSDNGLYAIGEILDIDGDCGGFNLQWAWSSAFCASESILKDF